MHSKKVEATQLGDNEREKERENRFHLYIILIAKSERRQHRRAKQEFANRYLLRRAKSLPLSPEKKTKEKEKYTWIFDAVGLQMAE